MEANSSSKILLVVPTYNEIETLPVVLDRLHQVLPNVDVLVVDDCSPDGTGQWVDHQIASPGNAWLQVMHRNDKQGLASAYTDGFRWALAQGYAFVGQMDADGSHRPEQFSRLIERINGLDGPAGVIGSRWTAGGGVTDWSKKRVALSKGGNLYIRLMLEMPLTDSTTGFRIYRVDALDESGVLDQLESRGYGFQVEMTYRLMSSGFTVAEVPITFDERFAGSSKMSWDIAIEELRQVTKWGLRRLIG